jgi:8-oxo-dGTP pyrophosphatase MutT (NUDIX family)
MDEGEDYYECAVREIREEINYNADGKIKADQFIRIETIKNKIVNLFIISGVDESNKGP